MKKSFKLRCIFSGICLLLVIYIGLKRNIIVPISGQEHYVYPLTINEVMIYNRNSIRDDDGDFESWVEIYNNSNTSINLNKFGLSNDSKQPFLWSFPEILIKPKSFCIVWISGKNKNDLNSPMHTNFKLKNKDTSITLTSPNNNWNDIFLLQPMEENISYGKKPDGSSNLYGFDGGTPGKTNMSEILIPGPNTKRLEKPIFSHGGGFYKKSFELILKSNDSSSHIYYTLDGSIPTKNSNKYTNPILIQSKDNSSTIIRARVYKDGYPKSEINTQSYFVNKDIYNTYNVPVISLVTDPKNLFDYEKGIYVAGKVFDDWIINNPNCEINQITPANYNQRGKSWERKASIELFQPDGSVGIIQNIGIRTYGGYSRASTLKPLSLFARLDYDDNEYFQYDFFGNNKEICNFSRILLRTSSTDSEDSLFRDALIQSLIKSPMILDTQNSKPCILFINGEYHGIRNIREALDKNYINNHYAIEKEDVVIIKNPTGIAGVEIQEGYVGDEMHYNRMIDYIKNHDIKINSNYNFITTQIDIDNFIEYNVLQIYCDNRDWPGNNVRIWRKRTPIYNPNAPYGHDGRWRWMIFDLDYGFGLFKGTKTVENNSLERATEPNGPEWPNPPWSTFLLRTLLQNNTFKNKFINIFADRLNTAFLPEAVIDNIETMKNIYYPNVIDHITKWNLHDSNIENWLDEIEVMKNFAVERPKHIRQHITEYFNLNGTAEIKVEVDKGGIVKLNTLNIENSSIPWEGIYFKDIPITVEAIPKYGFEFAGWEGIDKSYRTTIEIKLSKPSYLRAVFKEKMN